MIGKCNFHKKKLDDGTQCKRCYVWTSKTKCKMLLLWTSKSSIIWLYHLKLQHSSNYQGRRTSRPLNKITNRLPIDSLIIRIINKRNIVPACVLGEIIHDNFLLFVYFIYQFIYTKYFLYFKLIVYIWMHNIWPEKMLKYQKTHVLSVRVKKKR